MSEERIALLEKELLEMNGKVNQNDNVNESNEIKVEKLLDKYTSKTDNSDSESKVGLITDASDEKWSDNPMIIKDMMIQNDKTHEKKGAIDRLLTLARISFEAKQGELIAIVGQVGSGKSSVLGGLLGDMKLCIGKIAVKGSIAYMGQRPFIQNSTLRDNITFGLPFNYDR